MYKFILLHETQLRGLINLLAVTCPQLRRPNYGEVYPPSCVQRRTRHSQRCAFTCLKGFQLQGPAVKQCQDPGVWSDGQINPRCVGNGTLFDTLLNCNKV